MKFEYGIIWNVIYFGGYFCTITQKELTDKLMLKKDVLYAMEQKKGNVVTGGELAELFGVSRTSIWKAIHSLKADGNEIITVPNVGYRLLPTNDTLSKKIISDGLTTDFIGRSMMLLSSTHSTNQYLKEMDTSTIPDGYVVIADGQEKGRGRYGRTFISPRGEGIYMSILLTPKSCWQNIRLLTVCAAVAVSRAVENICGVRTDIKWVNDIFLNGKKLCGILTEALMSGELGEVDTIIVGIGINTGRIHDDVKDIATSVKEETGLYGIRNSLIAEVLNQFEKVYYDSGKKEKMRDILNYYDSRLFIKDKNVLVNNRQDKYTAKVLGIDENAALVVKLQNGDKKYITSGEIQLQ